MPLSKFLKRRNSSKDKKITDSNDTATEVNELLSRRFSESEADRKMTERPQENETLEIVLPETSHTPTMSSGNMTDELNSNKIDDIGSPAEQNTGMENENANKNADSKKEEDNLVKKISRSASYEEASLNAKIQETRRKKCDSETIESAQTRDKSSEKTIIQLNEKDLEAVIRRYVNSMISESVADTIKTANFDHLYQNIAKDLVTGKLSECLEPSSSTSQVTQRYQTSSISECVPLNVSETDGILDNQLTNGLSKENSSVLDRNEQSSSLEDKTDIGMNRDAESCVISLENKILCENPFDEVDCDSLGLRQIMFNKNTSDQLLDGDSVENKECSTSMEKCVDQLECDLKVKKTTTTCNGTVDCSFTIEKASSAITNPINSDLTNDTRTDILEVESVCQLDSSVSAEIENTPSSSKETEDAHEALDGYHADMEESESLHSIGYESCDEGKAGFLAEIEGKPQCQLGDSKQESISNHIPNSKKYSNASCMSLEMQAEISNVIDCLEDKSYTNDSNDLIGMSTDDDCLDSAHDVTEPSEPPQDLGDNLKEQLKPEDEKKINWKVGHLQVKLPHKSKSRSKGYLKVWKKRCVAIQPDEFANDPKHPCLMVSVYSGERGSSRKPSATFWKSVTCQKAVVYRSNSKTHRYAFTVSEDNKVIVHLSTDCEADTQEWMAAIRNILWPPSPVVQLEKMLNGKEFEISIIDNDFSFRAGLLGMYGYLTITPKKLILVHPQQGYVIQEWYLNTVDNFQLVHQQKIQDVHKVLAMTTCSDSSTGKGEILIYCREAVTLLQSLASTIHQILTFHSKQEGGKYQKELEQIAEWLDPQSSNGQKVSEDYYKVPPRQVKSLLDIPNFIFNKPLTPVASVTCTPGESMDTTLKPISCVIKSNVTRGSQDSGISAGNAADDFLNCSSTSFVVGGGTYPGKSSDSELSDTYTPPGTPEVTTKRKKEKATVTVKS